MRPYRFLHAADLHLDSPFRGLAQRDAELAERLCSASLMALERLVDTAIRRACDFVVFAGDIYDGLDRGIRAQLKLRRAAERLHDAGIPLIMLHGNHDPLDLGYTAVRGWPSSTTILSAVRPQVVQLDTAAGRVTITGQSFPSKKVTNSLAASYPTPSGAGLHVAVLHTELVRGEGTNAYSPCRLQDLVQTDFHYWALGHIHDPKVLHARSPVVAYPGNLQGRHFLECGARGALLVEGVPGNLTTAPVALAPFVFERVVLDVSGLDDLAAVQNALLDAVPDNEATVLLRAELVGRSHLFEVLHEANRRENLLVDLNQESGEDAIWMDLQNRVRPDLPWDTIREQQSLSGALIRRERDQAEIRAALKRVSILKDLSRRLDDEDLDRLAHRALYRVVDAIHPKELQ